MIDYLLYGEPKWSEMLTDLSLLGYSQDASNYDGYTFFVSSTFDRLPSQGDSWGLLVDIPDLSDGSSTGFGFYNYGDGLYTG